MSDFTIAAASAAVFPYTIIVLTVFLRKQKETERRNAPQWTASIRAILATPAILGSIGIAYVGLLRLHSGDPLSISLTWWGLGVVEVLAAIMLLMPPARPGIVLTLVLFVVAMMNVGAVVIRPTLLMLVLAAATVSACVLVTARLVRRYR